MDKSQLFFYKTVNAAKIVFVITGLRIIIQFTTQLILVRLLTPQIFGIFAFTQMTVYFFGLISNLNGNKLIIQKKESTNEIVDVVFTLEVLLGIFVTTILLFIADNITDLIGKQEITLYVKLLCPILILNPLFLIPKALFERGLNFKQSTIPTLFGAIANAISSIALVYLNFDIYALIYGIIVGRFVEIIVLWDILPYRPKLRFNKTVIKEILRYGLPMTFSAIVAFLYWNIDDFMVGKLLGNEQLGYYWVAFKFPHYLLVIQASLSAVLFPSFSRIDNNEQLKRGFETITKLSAIYLLIACILSLVFGQQIIKYFFGERWLPATLPFQIFMVLVAIRGIIAPWVDVYLSRGRSIAMLMNFVNLLGITVLGYFLTLWQGISGMAIAVLISILLSIPLIKYVMSSIITFSYLRIILKPLLVSIFILCIGFLIKDNIPSSFLSLILGSISLFILYLFILFFWEKRFFLKEMKSF